MAEIDTNVTATGQDVSTTADVEATETAVDTSGTEAIESAEITRLKAEMAKQKAALDKATKEAGDYRKQLKAKLTAEEAEAEAKREADEALQNELNDLRKRFAVAESGKKIMSFINDESIANEVANSLFGAEDIDSAIAAFQKAWVAKEKSLRAEYGKIPAPGMGNSDGPAITKADLDGMKYVDRVKYAKEHPDEYNKLMGR